MGCLGQKSGIGFCHALSGVFLKDPRYRSGRDLEAPADRAQTLPLGRLAGFKTLHKAEFGASTRSQTPPLA